jgi:hypothetical protein
VGWLPCPVKDIEDMDICNMDCSVPNPEGNIDDSWYIPQQWGIDNSAYTWRRDKQLQRGTNFPLWTIISSVTIVGVASIIALARSF